MELSGSENDLYIQSMLLNDKISNNSTYISVNQTEALDFRWRKIHTATQKRFTKMFTKSSIITNGEF